MLFRDNYVDTNSHAPLRIVVRAISFLLSARICLL
jgi:hypothetical protein